RVAGQVAGSLVQLGAHPALFCSQRLRAQLDSRTLPWLLTQAGSCTAVTLMAHLCHTILVPGSLLLHNYRDHVAHLLAFTTWSASPHTGPAALATARLDPAITLPPRVLLAAHVARMAREGSDPTFTHSLLQQLLAITRGGTFPPASSHGQCASVGSAAPPLLSYAWLEGREASQASAANSIKVAAWQALCLLALHLTPGQRAEELFVLALLAHGWPQGVTSHLLPAVATYEGAKFQVVVSVVLVALFYLVYVGPSSP
ncbi:SpoU_methylase domain-containing protein, partial [Haematococcus lacustris]